MNMNPPLSGAHLRTHEKIFKHPMSHNLTWREVRSLFGHIGEVAEELNGVLKVTRNGQTVTLHPSVGKEVGEVDELMKIRRFLEQTDGTQAAPQPKELHVLVVINHHEARLYRTEMRGSVPEQIVPHNPDEFFRHAHNSRSFARGREKPDPSTFFGPVAKALIGADRILIFGSGTGTSSEMEQLVGWLKSHHPELAQRIAGTASIDEHHLTEAQLLSRARAVYATLGAQRTST
jgi:hypothetical protein